MLWYVVRYAADGSMVLFYESLSRLLAEAKALILAKTKHEQVSLLCGNTFDTAVVVEDFV